MRGGLPRLQRQHQSTLWNLWIRCLLPHVGRLLQRDMHPREFRFAQLRRMRQRLRRIDTDLQSGRLYCDYVCRRPDILRRSLRQHEL